MASFRTRAPGSFKRRLGCAHSGHVRATKYVDEYGDNPRPEPHAHPTASSHADQPSNRSADVRRRAQVWVTKQILRGDYQGVHESAHQEKE